MGSRFLWLSRAGCPWATGLAVPRSRSDVARKFHTDRTKDGGIGSVNSASQPAGQSGAGGGKGMREGSAGQTTQRAATTCDFQSAKVLESTAAAVCGALTMRTVHN